MGRPITSEDDQDTPAVLAYRVGQLEKAVSDGFRTFSDKLDSLTHNFVTHADVTALEKQASAEHAAIRIKIDNTREALESDIMDVKRDVNALRKQRWIQNTLSAILGAVLAILISFFLNNVVK